MTDNEKQPAAEKCGKPAASFIPRWGWSFACVLPVGHDGPHQQGGNCFKHGEYIGKECPWWPKCTTPDGTISDAPAEQPAASGLTKERLAEIETILTTEMRPHQQSVAEIHFKECGLDLLMEVRRLRTTPQPAGSRNDDAKRGGELLYMALAKRLITRILEATPNYDSCDVELRLVSIIMQRDEQQAHIRSLEQQLAEARTQRTAGKD